MAGFNRNRPTPRTPSRPAISVPTTTAKPANGGVDALICDKEIPGGVLVCNMRVMASKFDGYDMHTHTRFKAGTQIAYKSKDNLTSEEREKLFPSGEVYHISVQWPLKPGWVPPAPVAVAQDFKANEYQQMILDALLESGHPQLGDHLLIRALAGCGKTSTLVWLIRELKKRGLLRGLNAIYLAFNKEIQEELSQKLQGTGVPARTTHSFCFTALKKRFTALNRQGYKPRDQLEFNRELFTQCLCDDLGLDYSGPNFKAVRKIGEYRISSTVIEMVSYVKNWAVFPKYVEGQGWQFSDAQVQFIDSLYDEYEVEDPEFDDLKDEEMPKSFDATNPAEVRAAVIDYTIRVVLGCVPYPGDQVTDIEFDDMLYLSLLLDLPFPKFDLVCTDESQDFNACQLLLLERLSNR